MRPERWAQVEALFQEAADLPADQRASFLQERCPDPELRREVESLLQAAGSQLTDAVASVKRASEDLIGSAAAGVEGRRLGPYRVGREIGRGGMGVVYLGERDDGEFERQVAIKVLPGALFSDEAMARFRNERAILAGLDHPNIARLLDGGATAEGVPYVVMEYVEGLPLDTYVREKGLDLESRIWLFLSICAAVQYAHRNLVVHRDLKPGNILVTEDGVPKLLDFGIAKLLTPEDELAAARTATRIMTPAFASPEQLRGERIGTPSDVYSLGLILYGLLAGELPYAEEDSTPAELSRRIAEEDPRLPSTVASNARLAGDLDTIALTALRREPERRYGSVEALADDLRRYLTSQPIAARPPTWGYRSRKFVQRNRAGVAAAAAVVTLLVGFGVAMVVQNGRVSAQRDAAERAERQAERASEFLVNLFELADPNEVGGADMTALELLNRGTDLAREQLRDEPETRAAVLDMIGSVHATMARWDTARALLGEARDLRREALGTEDGDYLHTVYNLGILELRRGDAAAALPLLEEATDGLRRVNGEVHESTGSALYNLGFARELRGDLDGAAAAYQQSAAVADALDPTGAGSTQPLNGLGGLLFREGRYDSAAVIFERVLDRQSTMFDGPHEQVASTLNNLATAYSRRRQYDVADSLYERSIGMRRALYGDAHPSTLSALTNLAVNKSRQGLQDEAITLLGAVVAARRTLDQPAVLSADLSDYGVNLLRGGRQAAAAAAFAESVEIGRAASPGHPDLAYPLSGLARTRVLAGDTAAAEPMLREALALRRNAFGDDHPLVAVSYEDLGRYLGSRRMWVAADSALTRALEIREPNLASDDLDLADSFVDVGTVRVQLGRADECRAPLERGTEIRRAVSEADDPLVAEAESALGGCLLLSGDRAAAAVLLRRSHSVLESEFGPDDRRTVQAAEWLARVGGEQPRQDSPADGE
ncbi:MAG: serine/threonine-protein kinase [Gemmatimonadota bacterium]